MGFRMSPEQGMYLLTLLNIHKSIVYVALNVDNCGMYAFNG